MDRTSLEALSFNDLKKKLMDLGLLVMADREKCIDTLADHCEKLHTAQTFTAMPGPSREKKEIPAVSQQSTYISDGLRDTAGFITIVSTYKEHCS